MTQPFGEGLWKNLQAVRFGEDGGIEAPVRADGGHGVRIGVDAVAATPSEASAAPAAAPRRRGLLRRLLRRG